MLAIPCPVVNHVLKPDIRNEVVEVRNVQNFLRTFEGIDIQDSGQYNEETVSAVKQFQMKYGDEVLTPWNVKTPTGIVGIITAKKINQIACGSPFEIGDTDREYIAKYKGSSINIPATSLVNVRYDARQDGYEPDHIFFAPVSVSNLPLKSIDDAVSSRGEFNYDYSQIIYENGTRNRTSLYSSFISYVKGLFGYK